jgi:N utilization substance protein B
VSARSKARKQALDLLYETDIRGTNLLETLETRDIPAEGPDARPIREYTRELVNGVSQNRRKIDELITTYAQGWDMDRLPAVDRNILRLGIFEILWSTEVPMSVAIDEALILAKELSSDESSKYIHGVLGRIASIKDTIAIQ